MKNFAKILFTLGLFIAIERLTHAATDGFTITRIYSDRPEEERWMPPPLSAQMKSDFEQIFSQEFHYLACGSQSFALKSADGNYILKFFKHHRFRMPYLFKKFPLPSRLNTIREERLAKKRESLEDTLNSCLLSMGIFKPDTGTLYVHLGKTSEIEKSVTIVDRLGIRHSIDLDTVDFVLQRCAQSVPEKFLSLRKMGKHDEAKETFDTLLSLTEKRSLLGYLDKDPNLIKNFGFLGRRPVEIDIGGFVKYAYPKPHRFYRKEIHKVKSKALPWFEKNYPEIASYVASEMDSLVDH